MLMASNWLWVIMCVYRLASCWYPMHNSAKAVRASSFIAHSLQTSLSQGPRYGRHLLAAVVGVCVALNAPSIVCISDSQDECYPASNVCAASERVCRCSH